MDIIKQSALEITETLRAAGYLAYFAGGCVRDQLLNKSPKDFDIATSATPKQVITIYPNSDTIGAHFGVVLVKHNRIGFEIATFRSDGSYGDGRRPDTVEFSSPEEDAARRDFTINGLFFDPETEQVIDLVDGQRDLTAQLIRAIGNPSERFEEDSLRLMRAIRFATVLGFNIEESTWNAICQHANQLERVAIERVREEFNKILLSDHRARGLDLLVESGLIKHIVPEVLELIGCEQPPQFHPEGDVYVHTRMMLDMLHDAPSLELCLAVLLHDIGKPATYSYDEKADRIRFSGHDAVGATMADSILRRLKYSNQIIEAVCPMVANHMKFMHVRQMRTSKLKRFMAQATFSDEIELHRVDCASSNGITENLEFVTLKQKEFAAAPLIPPALLTGKDLISMGYQPSPLFKQMLSKLETQQLEGKINSSDEARAWISLQFPI